MRALLLATAAALIALPAGAADWTIDPWTTDLSDYNLTVGGEAHGTIFSPDIPSAPGANQHWASGLAAVNLKLQRDYDSGLSLALKSTLLVAHDALSSDNYGGHLVQKVYATMQTGLGRVELGMTDGAAYALSVTGPVVDDATSMDNANASFFIDPATARDFTRVFALNSAVEASLNYAKISYYTPRLFGIQVAASFTPSEGRDVVPFLNNGPHLPNRQKNIWEGAVSYSNSFGDLSVGFYGGFSFAHGDLKTPGHAGLSEWGVGGELDYNLNDDMKLAVGGGYRRSNAYALDLYDVLSSGETESGHLSATLTTGPWILGGEMGNGTADGKPLEPVLGVRGFQASAGYVINANLQVTAGWQQLRYSRDAGSFYNGGPRIAMNAVFVHLKLHV